MNEKTVDERLQFLLASTESLHASCQELHAAAIHDRQASQDAMAELRQSSQAQDQRLHRLHMALLAAIRGFLESPDA